MESQAGSGPLSATSHCAMESGAVTSWASISSRPGRWEGGSGAGSGVTEEQRAGLRRVGSTVAGGCSRRGEGPLGHGPAGLGSRLSRNPWRRRWRSLPGVCSGGSAAETACVYVGERRPGFGAVAAARQVDHAPSPICPSGGRRRPWVPAACKLARRWPSHRGPPGHAKARGCKRPQGRTVHAARAFTVTSRVRGGRGAGNGGRGLPPQRLGSRDDRPT